MNVKKSSSSFKKRKSDHEITISSESEDSLTDFSSSDNDDNDWLIEESNSEDEKNKDNTLLSDDDTNSYHNTDFYDENDNVPLSVRWSNFVRDLNWSGNTTFTPTIHLFTDMKMGIQPDSGITVESTPSEIFKKFLSEDILEMISMLTNTYTEKKINDLRQSGKLKPKSRIMNYTNTSSDEMYCFHSLVILMGIIHKPTLPMYWTKEKVLETPFFREVMTYNRFRELLTLIHFSEDDDQDADKLEKIRQILETLTEQFQNNYRPGENISIDESLVPWKGRLSFKQFNRNKRARFGIKLFECCESKTGYVYNLEVYVGKENYNEDISKSIGKSGTVVKRLLRDLAGQGRSLYIDNWYTSPILCKQLLEEKTNVCGTVRTNRKFMPKISTKDMKVGDMKILYTPKLCFLAWKDKKVITMLTTMHKPEMINTGKTNKRTNQAIMKPNVVISYNSNMGGVDVMDQSLSPYNVLRKTVKWYHKLYFHVVDIAVFNAFVLYKFLHSDKNMRQIDFRLALVKELIEQHCKKRNVYKRYNSVNSLLCFSAMHFPSYISESLTTKVKKKRCFICQSKGTRKETRIMCKECCNVPLCVVPCFEKYHKKLNR